MADAGRSRDDVRSEIADLRQTPPGPGGIDEVNPGDTGFAARTLVALACSLSGYPHP